MAIIHNNVYKRTSSEHFYSNALQHMLITHTLTHRLMGNELYSRMERMKANENEIIFQCVNADKEREQATETHTHTVYENVIQ